MNSSAPGGSLLIDSVRCTLPHPAHASAAIPIASHFTRSRLTNMGGEYTGRIRLIQTLAGLSRSPAIVPKLHEMFLLITGLILFGNVAWWRWAHRRVRSFPRARLMQSAIA